MEKVKNKKRSKKGINVRTKEEKRQMRREKDKERKRKRKGKGGISNEEKPFDFDHSQFVDHVKFNEVVHAPPENLSKVKNYAERNPGKQNNLLLNKKLDKKGATKNISNKVVKAKKTDISLARKCMLEAERKRVIELYRKSKNKR